MSGFGASIFLMKLTAVSSSSLYYGGREGSDGPRLFEARNDARAELPRTE